MTKIVAILNLTPDSFFDGGNYNEKEQALKQLETLLENGADIIDVGAESTRPNATPISADQEWARLKNILPEIINLVQKYNQQNHKNIAISLDSRNWQTIAKAIELGIDIINDVSGFEDMQMIELAAKSGKKIVVMHNLGVPAARDKIVDPALDIVQVVIDWMENKLAQLLKAGVKKEQIIFDIGLGFGKNAAQSIQLIKQVDRLRVLDLPLYVGHSNKSFLDELEDQDWLAVGDQDFTNRQEKTVVVTNYLVGKNVEYLRLHNLNSIFLR